MNNILRKMLFFIAILAPITVVVADTSVPVGQDAWIKRFEKPIARQDMVNLWSMLLYGYSNALSADKCWGDVLPEVGKSHWIAAPKSRKGDAELVTRMLWGLGGWFSRTGRPQTLTYRGKKINVKSLMVDALKNGTNPSHEGYWKHEYAGRNVSANQFCVEAPAIALAYQIAAPEIKKSFTKQDKQNIMAWLIPATKGHRNSNWNLFHALAATVRKINGEKTDLPHLEKNIMSCLDWYSEEGIFSDGPHRHFDDYNFWVFGTHLMLWYELDKEFLPKVAKDLPKKMRSVMSHQPYYFGNDGSHPEFGRSITYKFTRLASLVQAYRLGMTDVPVGQIRRIIRLHLAHYLRTGAIETKRGVLLQTLAKNGSNQMREGYNFPGSTYWAMQTMGEIWKLDDNDPFWTAKEELLPVERKSFSHALNTPGWVLSGSKISGGVDLINVGSTGSSYYGSKYTKQVYSSQLGFCVGYTDVCDHMATLYSSTIKKRHCAPNIEKYELDAKDSRVLRQIQSYPKGLKGVELSHIIFTENNLVVRVTKITSPNDIPKGTRIDQGGFALGFTSPEKCVVNKQPIIIEVTSPRFQVIYQNLQLGDVKLKMDKNGYLGNRQHTRDKSYKLPYATLDLKSNTVQYIATASYGSTEKIDLTAFSKKVKVKAIDGKGCTFLIDGNRKRIEFLVN